MGEGGTQWTLSRARRPLLRLGPGQDDRDWSMDESA
jgi:hypothetical protein